MERKFTIFFDEKLVVRREIAVCHRTMYAERWLVPSIG